MGFIQELFGKSSLDKEELQQQLNRIEQQRRQQVRILRKISCKYGRMLDKIKRARQRGNDLEVDYRWLDLQQLQLEGAQHHKTLRILNLEGITIKKYLYTLDCLQPNDADVVTRQLVFKIKNSGLDAHLEAKEIDEQDYLDELGAIFNASGIEPRRQRQSDYDPAKSEFLAELDQIIAMETHGDAAAAQSRQEVLQKQWQQALELDCREDANGIV